MKILFATALLFAVATSVAYSQACHMREVDLCMAIGMFHYQSNGVPGDEEKVVEWCETMKEVQECMGNYSSKCLSPLQRELAGLLSGSENDARQLCVEGSEIRARYLQHAACLSEGADSDDFKNNIRDLQVIIEKLFDVAFKQRFPLLCCDLRRFRQEIESYTEKTCGKPAVEMVTGLMHMITTDLPDVICERFDPKSEECKSLLPAKGTPPKATENKSQLAKLLDTVFGNSK